jgi:hypothetical protein
VSETPLASSNAHLLHLTISSSNKDVVINQCYRHQSIAGNGHGCSVYPRENTEDADLSTTCACKQHIPISERESVVPNETSVGELASSLLQEVLHRSYVEVKGVDEHIGLVGSDDSVGRVLGVLVTHDVTPTQNGQRKLKHSCVANDESVVLPQSSQEPIIRRKSKFLHTHLHAL